MGAFFRNAAAGVAVAARKLRDGITEGLFVRGDEQSRSRAYVLLMSLASESRFNLFSGNFLTGLLVYLQASDSMIGLFAMARSLSNLLQLISPIVLNRCKHPKRVYILLDVLFTTFNGGLLCAIALLPIPMATRVTLMLISQFVGQSLGALHFPALTVWHIKFIPQQIRARFFSLQVILKGAAVAIVTMTASTVADALKAGGHQMAGYIVVYAVGAVFALTEAFCLWRMKDVIDRDLPVINLGQLFIKPLRERPYLLTAVLSALLWNFVANIPNSYYTVYLLNNVEVGYTFIYAVSLINIPMLIFATPLWSRVVRRTSWMKTLAIAMLGYGMHYLMLPFVVRGSLWLYVVSQVVAFSMNAGITLAFSGIPYVNLPVKDRSLYIGFYSTVANLGALGGAALGRAIISRTGNITLNVLGLEMVNKQYFFFFIAALMLAAVAAVYLVQRRVPQQDG